jgi:glycosyltransferase involved in cell wall biosynthesis
MASATKEFRRRGRVKASTARILNICAYGARGIPSTYSGYETFLTYLLPQLADRGHDVTIYCRKEVHDRDGEYRGVHLRSLPSIAGKNLSTLTHGSIAAAVARFHRHDVSLVVNIANAPFCLVARLFGERIVLNTDGVEWARGKWGPIARNVFRRSAALSRWASGALVSDCVAIRELYEQDFHAPSTVIPYCWNALEPTEEPNLEPLGLHRDRYFVVAGRLNPENHVDKIAEAFVRAGVDVPLVVLGAANYDSPVLMKLEELASTSSSVELMGHQSDRATYGAIIENARCYIHGHSVGGINPSLLEAMGRGAQVLALDTRFNREALGDAGTYFGGFDEELCRVLKQVSERDAATEDRYRRRSAERAHRWFSGTQVVDAYERLLLAVADRPRWATTLIETDWGNGSHMSETAR